MDDIEEFREHREICRAYLDQNEFTCPKCGEKTLLCGRYQEISEGGPCIISLCGKMK